MKLREKTAVFRHRAERWSGKSVCFNSKPRTRSKGSHVGSLPALPSNTQNFFNRISRALSWSGINTVVIPGTKVCIFFHCSVKHDLDLKDKPRMRACECGKVYIGPAREQHLHIRLCQHWFIRASTTVIVSCSTIASPRPRYPGAGTTARKRGVRVPAKRRFNEKCRALLRMH